MTTSTPPFDIAIVGGGIAGLSLAIGLLRFNIAVTIYESAHAFHEIGVGLGIAPNTKRAMQLISPEIAEEVGKLSTFNAWESKRNALYDLRRGMPIGKAATTLTSDLPQLICPVPSPTGMAAVHRARLLDVLIKLIPEGTANGCAASQPSPTASSGWSSRTEAMPPTTPSSAATASKAAAAA